MRGTKFQYRSCLIAGLVITFLFVGKTTYTYAQGEYPATLLSIQHELKEIKSLPPFRLGFELVGTIIAGEENSYAFIMDETSGKQSMYKLGESIKNEVTVLKIDKESIIVEKDGRAQVLRMMGGSYTVGSSSEIPAGNELSSLSVSEELPYFEPVSNETGPPGEENISVEDFQHFEPVTNNTGPEIDDGGFHEDPPTFEPSVSYLGPPE